MLLMKPYTLGFLDSFLLHFWGGQEPRKFTSGTGRELELGIWKKAGKSVCVFITCSCLIKFTKKKILNPWKSDKNTMQKGWQNSDRYMRAKKLPGLTEMGQWAGINHSQKNVLNFSWVLYFLFVLWKALSIK